MVPSTGSPGTASYRVVYTPSVWENCMNILPVGVSEKWGTAHYSDQTDRWRAGELKPMWWSRAQVEAAATVRTAVLPEAAAQARL